MGLSLRLRTFLLVVGIVAVVTWLVVGVMTDRRRARFRERADSFAFGEADVLDLIAEKLEAATRAEGEGSEGKARATKLRAEAEHLARVAAWHVKMERKYAYAVEHPWRAFPPDGPSP